VQLYGVWLSNTMQTQIHDYLNVSFFRLPAETRAATKKTIEVLSAHYPEMLSRKYFVNVPVVMGWMFTATKAFLAKETVAKFQVLSYGSYIAAVSITAHKSGSVWLTSIRSLAKKCPRIMVVMGHHSKGRTSSPLQSPVSKRGRSPLW
jgi:hypothetical protein